LKEEDDEEEEESEEEEEVKFVDPYHGEQKGERKPTSPGGTHATEKTRPSNEVPIEVKATPRT
jgi:hypothetical protein